MQKFYFTYGTEGHPYSGGWTEVFAPDLEAAITLFRSCHPDKQPGLINCSSIRTERSFYASLMARPGGNFGHFCQEIITMQRTVFGEEVRP